VTRPLSRSLARLAGPLLALVLLAPTTATGEIAERGPARPWPAFRGADRAGIGDGQGAPAAWDAPGGAGLAWKTPIPGLGLSSPVVWGDRVFVTTAVSDSGDDSIRTGVYGDVDSVEDRSHHAWKVYALDLGTGVVVWERVAAEGPPQVKRHLKSSHANPTPATDGERVVVSFGSEGLFCYGFDGRLLWRKDLGVLSSGWFYDPTYEWGFGSSPILHDGAVIVQVDVQQGSFIAALDAVTGREGEPVLATPAISDGLELIRGKGHLFALGEPPAGPGEPPGGAGEAPSDPGGEAAGASPAAAGPAEERPSENTAGGAR
jgi:outer membrane protein assembly factor BamB